MRSSEEMPTPWSEMLRTTSARRASPRITIRPPSGEYLTALSRMLRRTWRIQCGSAGTTGNQIGRASCRERGEISVVAVSLKKKDGIRDVAVTGVQTCALPIWRVLDGVVQDVAQDLADPVRVGRHDGE